MISERLRFGAILPLAALLIASCEPSPEAVKQGSDAKTLTAMADHYGTDKGSHRHLFTEIYGAIFGPRREEQLRVLEIGVKFGASMRMWRDFFPKATVFGIDIDPTYLFQEKRIKTMLADQAKRVELQAVIDRFGSQFDVVLDDGGHQMDQQQISFAFFFQHVAPGGYYVLEDLHTSKYAGELGADPSRANTSLKMLFDFIWGDGLHSQYMTSEEIRYIEENVEYVNVFHRATRTMQRGRERKGSITAIIRKKREP
jgi:hypothetical protein